MEIQFQHHHVLTFCDQNMENFSHILLNERKRRKVDGDLEFADLDDEVDCPECCVCFEIVDDGPVYFCEICDGIWVHKFCASLPREVRAHPLHLQHHHSLTLQTTEVYRVSCDCCGDIIIIPNYYKCSECGLKLDCKCALSPDNDNLQQITASLSPDTKTQISHDSHHHTLFLFNSRSRKKWPFSSYRCKLCERFLLDLIYGCFYCDFYLHKRCVEISQQECEVQHTCHSHHPVSIEYHCEKFICDQCRDLCSGFFMAICKKCEFKIDLKCAFLRDTTTQRSIGDEVKTQIRYFNHDQHLLSFFNCTNDFNLQCEECRLRLSGPGYGCLECSVYLHKSCAERPQKIQHPFHPFHSLFLENSKEYCSACCIKEKSPRYRCLLCPWFCLDTQCAVNNLGVISALKNKEDNNYEKFPDLDKLSISPRCMKQFLIKDKFNDHILNYFENITSFFCYLCDELVKSPRYECSFCQIHLHKECAQLPFKIKYDLHEHPLSIRGGEFFKRFICDGCQVYHQSDMCYHCEECSFSLDRMCAQGIPSTGNHYQKLNDNGSKVGISHFSHNHKLRFAFIPEKLKVNCSACRLLISGPTYCCYSCDFFLHESCFDKLKPQYIQHPFHIQHPLHFKDRKVFCRACRYHSDIGYQCIEGDFMLDINCVKYLTSGLQHKCHEHKLFCFVAEDILSSFVPEDILSYFEAEAISDVIKLYWCERCDKMCNAFFYLYLDCNVNLHIECMSIPRNVNSVCHVHPLTLMDSINEEGRDEYYCHACENLRNPKHAAYCCKKCYYTAHIGCVLDEEDGEIEIL